VGGPIPGRLMRFLVIGRPDPRAILANLFI